jgi:hypothetical protein
LSSSFIVVSNIVLIIVFIIVLIYISVAEIRTQKKLNFAGKKLITWDNSDLELKKTERLSFHSNGIQFSCFDKDDYV